MSRGRTRGWWITVTVATAALVGVVFGGAWVARVAFDPQWTLTLHDVMSSEPDANDPTTEVTEITPSACSLTVPCVEAYDTAEATYLRFGSRENATQHASTLEDGFQSNYIVMDFDGKDSATTTQQLWAMQHLAGMWQDYEGEFPER